MTFIENLIRPSLLKIKPYSSARDEYKGSDGIFLDANENPFGELNRYPDPYQKKIKAELSKIKSISTDSIFIGNGSDEIIDLAFRIFCRPAKDKALTFSPTYGMYEVCSALNDAELLKIPLNNEFQIDLDKLDRYIHDSALKLIFICSPNNPTGNSIQGVEEVVRKFKGIVIIDEAYIDFSEQPSWTNRVLEFPNLIVTQTFSKAWGLAAARVGVAYAQPEIIAWFNKVKPPYNISQLNQTAALSALQNKNTIDEQILCIKSSRDQLINELKSVSRVKKIFPSDANFILVEFDDAEDVYKGLINKKVITRNRNSVIKNCVRITIGTPLENAKLISELKKM
ncbi:MAG: histidinol-phosphate transaminase [Crocinitomicaceae bacterium]|nr:histidinol-phosphate transaminase [Crocinitomicaceae bacterium]MBK8926085.1 histidinol-phosphate transaminase [Crocinitomicaceae bacterium]